MLLYALFLDATSGFFVIIMIAAALALTAVLHIYAVIAFDCDISADNLLAEKGDDIRVTVRTHNRLPVLFLPTVFEIKLNLSEHLDCESAVISATLAKSAKVQIFTIKAAYWGKGNISIESVRAVDVLGVFAAFPVLGRFSSKHSVFAKNALNIKIFPSIPLLSTHSDFVRTLEEASAFDDNEQSREVSYAVTGFPGYEHRDYVPGDPLKRVNWKLSAKRDRLLVRKPEAFAGGDQVLVLDDAAPTGFKALAHSQSAIEAMLALATALTKHEILCRTYVRFESGWLLSNIQCTDDIEQLRFALCDYSFSNDTRTHGRMPDLSSDVNSASGFVVFTARPDDSLYEAIEQLRQKGIIPEIASAIHGSTNNWRILEENGEVVFARV